MKPTVFLLAFLLLALQVYAIPHTLNITVTNTTITIQDGLANQSFNNTPAAYTFTAATDCSLAFNYSAINLSVDYDRIRNGSTFTYNLSCPQPSCPPPNCPQPSCPPCPALDYSQVTTIVNLAANTSYEKVMGKLSEMNSSITTTLQNNKSLDFSKYYPYAAIMIALVAYLTRGGWLPKIKQIKEKAISSPEPREHPK